MAKAIADAIKDATKLVENVPAELKQVAFTKAFDAIMAEQNQDGSEHKGNRPQRSTSGSTPTKGADEKALLNSLNRTKHPDIKHNATSLHNSLRVLMAVRDDLGIDGLTASAIQHVLVDKFRCRVTRQAVSQALNDAGSLVNRHKEGNNVIFRIMARGEEFLDKSPDGSEARATLLGGKASELKRTKATPNKRDGSTSSKAEGAKTKTKKSKTAGAAGALAQLLESGFFSKPRLIGDIVEHLKISLGRTIKQSEMQPALLRYLRSQKLVRKKNSENQYEYQNA